MSRFIKSTTAQYTIAGILFGLIFPLVGSVIAADSFSLQAILIAQQTNPVLWIVNTAPVWLGLLAYFIGRKQVQMEQLSAASNASLTAQIEQFKNALDSVQVLHRVTESLVSLTNLVDALQVVVDTVAEILPANRVALITFDMDREEVIHFVKGGPGEE
jgi:two-component system aerobic respiration control sensor histidine kinase ArcB